MLEFPLERLAEFERQIGHERGQAPRCSITSAPCHEQAWASSLARPLRSSASKKVVSQRAEDSGRKIQYCVLQAKSRMWVQPM